MTLVPIDRYATRDRENGKNPRWHRHERGHCGRWGHDNRATPDDPVDIASGDTSNSPYGAAYNARRQNPGLPHRIDDKHHPSRFFPRRADQEYGEKEKRTGQTANSPAGMRKAPAGTLLRTGRKRSPVFSFPHAKRHISKTHETTQEAARSPGTPSRPQAEEKNKRKKIGMPFEAQTSARNATSSRIAAGSIPGKPSPVSENLFKPERQPNPSRPRTENPSHGWADIRSETGL
jgi:hypothetical protein